MSLNRYDKRKDANHAAIVRDLRKLGYAVIDLSAVGGGCPDLLVVTRQWKPNAQGFLKPGPDQFVLAELKVEGGKLNDKQIEWNKQWNGPAPIIARCTEDIVEHFTRLSVRKRAEKWTR